MGIILYKMYHNANSTQRIYAFSKNFFLNLLWKLDIRLSKMTITKTGKSFFRNIWYIMIVLI